MKNTKSFYILFLIMVITACTPFGRLYKEQPRVTLALPVNKQAEMPKTAENDSTVQAPPLNFTFVRDNGDSIPVGMTIEWDSINKENLTTMTLDEVVVSASSTRNTAERNGLVNVEFVVTVPRTLQQDNWMVNVRPVLMRGNVSDSLKELRFTGQRFREMQERDYRRYDRFIENIIPDSVNFYRTYVDYRSFERYLERLKWHKRGLEKRWAIQEAKKRCPDLLLLRFEMFNRQVSERDSLMKDRMLRNSHRMITRQWWRYNRALARMNDTLQYQSKYLLERFRFFNNKWANNATFQSEGLISGRSSTGFFRRLLPLYTYHRSLPDSVQRRTPGIKTLKNFELSRVDSVATINRYMRRYECLQSAYPQYRLVRELYNVHPPALRHAARQASYGERLAHINSLDSTTLVKMFYRTQKFARNEARKATKDEKFRDIVRYPFNPEAHLDTVIYAADQVHFLYSQKVLADENSARMKVYVVGNVLDSKGNMYPIPESDTLTYLVSSMTKFIDKTPRFMRKVVTRDAEANTSVNFYFPKSRFSLNETIDMNRQGVKQVHDLTLALMTDPVYIIDSLTLFATSSPEGSWHLNGEIAQKRAESIRNILIRDFKQLYDSLAVGAVIEMDEVGNISHREVKEEIPNLPELIKIHTVPEGWDKLRHLIMDDKNFKGNRGAILQIIDREPEPDRREWLIKSQYKPEYAYMVDKLYPAVRTVDFRFSLSRRGMQQDTLYTNEPDTAYARAMEYLEKRKYEQALDILRPYEDMNTAIAYMSLGYDKAALRIFGKLPQNAESKYMQAILQARLGNEKQAIQLLLSAADMNAQMKFRANLDPELSVLVKKYGLFKEEDDW